MDHGGCDTVRVEQAGPLEEWRYGQPGTIATVPTAELSDEPWIFGEDNVRALFARIRGEVPDRLSGLAKIEVGVQTSADEIYLISDQPATKRRERHVARS